MMPTLTCGNDQNTRGDEGAPQTDENKSGNNKDSKAPVIAFERLKHVNRCILTGKMRQEES